HFIIRKFLTNIYNNLPTSSPIDNRWPSCLKCFIEVNEELKRIFHKWRCYKYRQKLDQIECNKMHEKAIASTIFKDKKLSYARSVPHIFCGDYIKLRQNPKWLKMSHETYEHYIVFADIVHKINRSDGSFVQKLLVVTTKGLLIIDYRTLEAKYIIPAFEIIQISLSPFSDGIVAFNIKPHEKSQKGDFMIISNHAIEITSKLYLVILNICNKPPIISISPKFQLNLLNTKLNVTVISERSPIDEIFAQLPKISKKANDMNIII
ncbi:unnamed protein product, partial [Gordionus sp. m RMFG-2023]